MSAVDPSRGVHLQAQSTDAGRYAADPTFIRDLDLQVSPTAAPRCAALLAFVAGDDPALLVGEAAALRAYLGRQE